MKNKYPHIFEPMTIRRMTVKNRIVMTPMGTNYGEQNGEMSFLHINYYEQRYDTAPHRLRQLYSASVQIMRKRTQTRCMYRNPVKPCRCIRNVFPYRNAAGFRF